MRILAIALALPLAACTLNLGGDDAPPPGDDGVDVPPDPPPVGGARMVIGSQPAVDQFQEGWASVWVNYPAYDCEPIDRYGAELAVLADASFDAFVEASAAGSPKALALGWLTLVRDSDTELWRVTEWVPDGEPQPACYHW